MDRLVEQATGVFGRGLIEPAVYGALRTAMMPMHIAGLGPSRQAARDIGRLIGRAGFNRKRVKLAAERLGVALPGLDARARTELVYSSYEHLCQLAVEFTLAQRLLNEDSWPKHVDIGQVDQAVEVLMRDGPVIVITGHCGNWEVIGYSMALLGFPMHVLYRPLDVRPMDRWVRQTRGHRGLELVDKFGAAEALPRLLDAKKVVGFVADQNAGDRGLHVPFFNRLASTYKTIGLLAIKYETPIVVGYARRLDASAQRVGGEHRLGYRLEIADTIRPDDWVDQPDPLFYLTARYRRAIERMVRQQPEQYLWMHRIWKSRPRHERLNKPFPAALRAKLEALPWMGTDEVAALMDRSEKDRAWLGEHGVDRLP